MTILKRAAVLVALGATPAFAHAGAHVAGQHDSLLAVVALLACFGALSLRPRRAA